MSLEPRNGMGKRAALRMEYAIIGLGILALLMIFQPFSLTVFSIGCMLVVLAGLINNLLPLAQPLWSDLGPRQREILTPLEAQWNALPSTSKRAWVKLADRVP